MDSLNQILKLLSETESLVSTAERYGRIDKRIEYNLLKERVKKYMVLRNHYSVIYSELLEEKIINVIIENRKNLEYINELFEKLSDIRSNLLGGFNVVEKSSMAYGHLKYLTELMELYLKFDKFEDFQRLSESYEQIKKSIKKSSVILKEKYVLRYDKINEEITNYLNAIDTSLYIGRLEEINPEIFDINNPTEMFKNLNMLEWELREKVEDYNKIKFRENLDSSLTKRIATVKSLTF